MLDPSCCWQTNPVTLIFSHLFILVFTQTLVNVYFIMLCSEFSLQAPVRGAVFSLTVCYPFLNNKLSTVNYLIRQFNLNLVVVVLRSLVPISITV